MSQVDPLTFYAWAARPAGPLSDLYMTGEQTETVYRWLSSILSQAREDERGKPQGTVLIADLRYTHQDGYAAALRDAAAAVKALCDCEGRWNGECSMDRPVAAIEALGGDRGNGGVTTALITGPAADRIREALGGER